MPPGAGCAVALSGGRDSMALLDAAATLAQRDGRPLAALHVHHGLSPDADRWAQFCLEACARYGIPFRVERISIDPAAAAGIEAAARMLRYTALAHLAREAGTRFVLLAHHQDDQAETLLLQLARGAGPHGLGAMAPRRDHDGITWLRPFLALPRAAIDEAVRHRGLPFVEDASNADPRHRRNAVRSVIAPRWRELLPGYPATLARAAGLQAEAAQLADELAALDAGDLGPDCTLDRRCLALAPHRARNVLRWFLRRHGLRPPSAARLDAMVRALGTCSADARTRIAHDGVEIGVHRGRVVVHRVPAPAFALAWRGERTLALAHGTLAFDPAVGVGVSLARLAGRPVEVRSRRGGERIALAPSRPRRSLKHLMQEAGVPAWERGGLPLLFADEALVAVAGIGIASGFEAHPGEDAIQLTWHPHGLAAAAG